MKNVYSLLTKMLFLSLFMALPMMFFGQESAKGDETQTTQKTQTTSNFSPYWFLQADYGSSWAHAEVSTTTFVPDFRSNVFVGNGNLAFGRQLKSWLSVYGNITRGYAKGRLWSQKNTYGIYSGKNMWFTSDYYGADANLGVNVSDLLFGVKDRKWYVGVHAGLGQIQWKSKTLSNGSLVARHGY